jgi:hypothetical protein
MIVKCRERCVGTAGLCSESVECCPGTARIIAECDESVALFMSVVLAHCVNKYTK